MNREKVFKDKLIEAGHLDTNTLDTTIGRKHDGDKPRFDLIPPLAQLEFVNVLTFGAKKYDDDNWRLVENPKRRYFAAAMRHLWDFWRGETHDQESGLHHLAHAMCCVAFMLELDLKDD